jgi:hypothetical protein
VHPPPSPAYANFTLMMEFYARKQTLLLCVLCGFDSAPPRTSVRPRGDDRTDFSLPSGRLLRAARDSGDREDVQQNYILKNAHKIKFNILYCSLHDCDNKIVYFLFFKFGILIYVTEEARQTLHQQIVEIDGIKSLR